MGVEFNVVDGLILAFLLISTMIGFYQGLIASFFNFFGYIIAAIVTRFYFTDFKSLIIEFTSLDDWITRFIGEKLSNYGSSSSKVDLNYLDKVKLPEEFNEILNTYNLTDNPSDIIKSMNTDFASGLSDIMLTIFSIIMLFVLILIAIKVVVNLLDLVARLPIISSFNKLGGVLFGFVKGIILLSLFSLIVLPILSFSEATTIMDLVNQSILANYIIEYNFILVLIGRMIISI